MPTVHLSITINSLTGEVEALAYEKAFLKDFLETQARELHLPTLEPVFKKARQQIKDAKDSVELQRMMLIFSKECNEWKGE